MSNFNTIKLRSDIVKESNREFLEDLMLFKNVAFILITRQRKISIILKDLKMKDKTFQTVHKKFIFQDLQRINREIIIF